MPVKSVGECLHITNNSQKILWCNIDMLPTHQSGKPQAISADLAFGDNSQYLRSLANGHVGRDFHSVTVTL